MLLEVSAICGILILLFYCAYSFAYAPYQVWKRYGIKGPTPVPFFGNYREEAKMKQSKYFKHLYQKYGPVVGYYIGQKPHILVADLDMLKQVLVKDFNNFIDREILVERICLTKPRGLSFEEGETWKRNRRILAPTFSVTKMKIIMPLMQKTVDSLVKVFEDKTENTESFDCFKTYCSFTMETILAIAFGWSINIQGGEADELTEAATTFFAQSEEGKVVSKDVLITLTSNFPFLIPIFQFLFNKTKAGEDAGKLVEIAQKIVQARKESGQRHRDMLQLLIDATDEETEAAIGEVEVGGKSGCPIPKKEGRLTNEEVVGNARVLLLAGYETTANALAYTTYLLALNPDIQEKLQSEIDSYFKEKPDASAYEASQEITYLDNVIQESLRFYPPATRIDRVCSRTTNVKGVTIPQGSVVVVPIRLLHHNPQYWKDPENFDPDRFKAEERAKRPQLAHMPFGFGPRNCIAMRFALLEAKVALIELLKKYTFVRTADTEVPLLTAESITTKPKNGIYLKVVNRS